MKLTAFEIPENVDQQPEWLERQLMGLQLQEVVANLHAVHSSENDEQALESICGDQLKTVLQSGLSALSQEQFQLLLTTPNALFVLQEHIFEQGSEYWLKIPADEELRSQQKNSWQQIATELHIDSQQKTVVKEPTAGALSRSRWILRLVTLAAVVLLSLLIAEQFKPAPGWGWNNPAALQADLTDKEYLHHLADGAQEWYNKIPETREELAIRITQFRQGCETLIHAPHPPLQEVDREWLKERCQAWAEKLDQNLADLEAGKSVETVQAAANATIDKLITALRKRADALS